MVTIAALFQGEPELGAELIHACLPGLLSYLVQSGGKLTDVGPFLQEPADVISALRSMDWAVDDDFLETLTQAETGPILRSMEHHPRESRRASRHW